MTYLQSQLLAQSIGNDDKIKALRDLDIAFVKIGIIEIGKTNLMNASAQEIKDLALSIHQSLAEIENAHHNDRAEVCVALQFLKETIIDLISQYTN